MGLRVLGIEEEFGCVTRACTARRLVRQSAGTAEGVMYSRSAQSSRTRATSRGVGSHPDECLAEAPVRVVAK